MNAVLSNKGQLTIPKKMRKELGLEAGSVLKLIESNGKIIVSKTTNEDPVDEWVGFAKLPKGETVDGYIKRIRGR